jgi:hypothetical protein
VQRVRLQRRVFEVAGLAFVRIAVVIVGDDLDPAPRQQRLEFAPLARVLGREVDAQGAKTRRAAERP